MTVDQCFLLGEIKKTRGYKGEVVAELDVDDSAPYNKLVPFFIETLFVDNTRAQIIFTDIQTEEDARELVGKTLYLPLTELPELADDQYYFHDLVNCSVLSADSKNLGQVTGIIDHDINPLLAVNYEGKEWLVPIHDEFITSVDKHIGEIRVNLPEGYLDIYLS